MSEEQRPTRNSLVVPGIIMASGAGAMLLSLGLCGVGSASSASVQGAFFSAGVLFFFAGALALAGGFVAFVVVAIANLIRK